MLLSAVFVNGATDAPNAIACCVGSGAMSFKKASLMAAIMNFLGAILSYLTLNGVFKTFLNTIDYSIGINNVYIVVFSCLLTVVLWAVVAWCFGIPTSESHALIAGLTGGAIAIHGGLQGVNGSEWIKVIYGLILSVLLGFTLGWIVCKIVVLLFRCVDRAKTEKGFRAAQIFGAASMSFMHGAQDGQKFMGVILLCMLLINGQNTSVTVEMPIWIMLLCSIVMGVGTSIGGKKIIKSVGMDMVKLENYQGFSADIAAAGCLLISSVFGIPVSTTHTKTTAIMGVGAARRLSAVNWGVVREMVLTWVLTFPGCGLIGFLMAKLFFVIF